MSLDGDSQLDQRRHHLSLRIVLLAYFCPSAALESIHLSRTNLVTKITRILIAAAPNSLPASDIVFVIDPLS